MEVEFDVEVDSFVVDVFDIVVSVYEVDEVEDLLEVFFLMEDNVDLVF